MFPGIPRKLSSFTPTAPCKVLAISCHITSWCRIDIPVFIGLYTSQLASRISEPSTLPARRVNVRLSPTWPQTNEPETAGLLRSWRRNISRDPLHLRLREEIGWWISILSDLLKRENESLESEAKTVDLHRNCLQMMGFLFFWIVYQQASFQVVGAVNFQFNTSHSCVWSHEVMSFTRAYPFKQLPAIDRDS